MTREQVVQSLVRLDRPLSVIEAEIRAFPWDWDARELARLDGAGVLAILKRRADGELTDHDVERWADLVELREDIELTPEAIEAVALLASPESTGLYPRSVLCCFSGSGDVRFPPKADIA